MSSSYWIIEMPSINSHKFIIVGAIAILATAMFAPPAEADIFEVETATSCPGSLGGGLCNGSVPFQLSTLLALLSVPNSIGSGTQKYIVTNDIGSSFSFTLNSTGQNNTGVADNGSCQINGAGPFNGCSIVDALNHHTSLGATQINQLTFAAVITFTGGNLGDTFKLGFVSMQGNSATSPVPLPAAFPLFATGLGALGLLGWRRKRKAQAAI